MIDQYLQDPAAMSAPMPDPPELDECTKLIRKLRWIGLDEEARRLEEHGREHDVIVQERGLEPAGSGRRRRDEGGAPAPPSSCPRRRRYAATVR